MMPLLRLIAVALLASGSAALLGLSAVAEPLDKEVCAALQVERKKLLTHEMQAALERGPDWVKDHLDDAELEQVRQFLAVEEKIEFRCRGGGVAKPKPVSMPLPDRKPSLPQAETADTGPSDTSAGSDQTTTSSLLPERKPSPSSPETAGVEPNHSETGGAEPNHDVAGSDNTAASQAPDMGSGQNVADPAKAADPGPSQTVADSDKTVPTKTKATR
jgi:hypothetical protein